MTNIVCQKTKEESDVTEDTKEGFDVVEDLTWKLTHIKD